MKLVTFSAIHLADTAAAIAQLDDLLDWDRRCRRLIPGLEAPWLIERGVTDHNPTTAPSFCAGIPDTRPYHCKDWSYGVAAWQYGLFLCQQFGADLVVTLCHDAILGVPLGPVIVEFLDRPEIMAGPAWHGSPDTHLLLLKREAITDCLYSLPFAPLPRMGGNRLYFEHALGELERRRRRLQGALEGGVGWGLV